MMVQAKSEDASELFALKWIKCESFQINLADGSLVRAKFVWSLAEEI